MFYRFNLNQLYSIVMILYVFFSVNYVYAEKVLFYSERNGIMWVEKSELEKVKRMDRLPVKKQEKYKKDIKREVSRLQARAGVADRMKKDHKSYFEVGKKYFLTKNYKEAIKFFGNAYKIKKEPKYYLFIAKCYGELNKPKKMLKALRYIIKKFPQSDVADDALFGIAYFYQNNGDYNKSIEKYKQLAEQYPYGVSVISNLNFRTIARKQIRAMEHEVDYLLKLAKLHKGTIAERLKKVQKENNIRVTGVVNATTLKALKNVKVKSNNNNSKLINFISISIMLLLVNLIWALFLYKKIKQYELNMNNFENLVREL